MLVRTLLTASLALAASTSQAALSYTTPGGTVSEDFDSLSSTGFANSWTNNSTLPGWYIFSSQSISGATGRVMTRPDDVAPANWVAVDTYTADVAMPIRSRVYSVGDQGSSERALGGYTTASGGGDLIYPGDNIYALALQNNTGTTLTQATVTYTGEQWQGHFNPGNGNALDFSYLVKSGFNPQLDIPTQNTYAPYTEDSDLDFIAPQDATSPDFALDGNDPANSETLSKTLTGLSWASGDYLILRWIDNDNGGEDFGLAIDDVSVVAIPEPATLSLIGAGAFAALRRRRA